MTAFIGMELQMPEELEVIQSDPTLLFISFRLFLKLVSCYVILLKREGERGSQRVYGDEHIVARSFRNNVI